MDIACTSITRRERDVIALVAEGWTNQEVAGALCISIETVKSLVHHALERTGARNRVELTVAWHQGILTVRARH